ncbi:MAG: tRNA pseudouridine(38-40) synthase TruA [Proteocatella sp.]
MNVKLTIEYIGTSFSGWQKQKKFNTVQAEIESAIMKITGEKAILIASGRTDAGVHAFAQVANFHTSTNIPAIQLKYALNSILHDNIKILESCEVEDSFHSRFGAKRKTYLYRIQTGDIRRSFERNRSFYVKGDLNFEKMQEEASYIIGEHDFSAFKSEGSTAKNFIRTIYSLELRQNRDIIEMEISGNGFLYNMVRLIAGTLVEIGKDREYSMKEILDSKSRTFAGPTAPAMGLFLKNVAYAIDNKA